MEIILLFDNDFREEVILSEEYYSPQKVELSFGIIYYLPAVKAGVKRVLLTINHIFWSYKYTLD